MLQISAGQAKLNGGATNGFLLLLLLLLLHRRMFCSLPLLRLGRASAERPMTRPLRGQGRRPPPDPMCHQDGRAHSSPLQPPVGDYSAEAARKTVPGQERRSRWDINHGRRSLPPARPTVRIRTTSNRLRMTSPPPGLRAPTADCHRAHAHLALVGTDTALSGAQCILDEHAAIDEPRILPRKADYFQE